MLLEGWLTLAIVLGVSVAMAKDLAPDFTLFVGLALVVIFGILSPEEALLGFANPATATIAVLFIVAKAVQDTGAFTLVSRWVFGQPRGPKRALLRLLVPVSMLSAFMNNTPIVAMLIPVVRDYARSAKQSSSRMLMPMSFAAILGGSCTVIGTSSNLVVSGLLAQAGYPAFSMFELGVVGLPTAIIGILYLTFIGRHLLPNRVEARAAVHQEAREYLAEVQVAHDSPLVGRTVEESGLRHLPGLFLMEIRRANGRIVRPIGPHHRLRADDHLVFTGVASTVQDLRRFPGLTPVDAEHTGEVDRPLFEAVISHNSPLIGNTVAEIGFRRRFGAAIMAIHRSGDRIRQKIGEIRIEPGDTLMLAASPGFFAAWQDSQHFYLISEVDSAPLPRYRQARIALAALAFLVLYPALTGTPLFTAALISAVVLLLAKCTTPRVARQAISWNILILIGSAFGLAKALDSSGAAHFIAGHLAQSAALFGPTAALASVYLLTLLFASVISNAAAAALLFPIALRTAEAAQLDPRPFAVAVALASAAVFSTPMAYANLLIYGPGGYRFSDFTRVGLPLNALCLVIAITLIPWFWPLAY